jgi:type IV secretion system protein VirB3
MSFRDPVFRGCTRPPMFLGAPMVPFILVTGIAILAAMLGLFVNAFISVAVVTVYAPIYAWMRIITKSDDQRLNQMILRLRLRLRMQGAHRLWSAVTYTPIKLKKR